MTKLVKTLKMETVNLNKLALLICKLLQYGDIPLMTVNFYFPNSSFLLKFLLTLFISKFCGLSVSK